jgi:hypothetical protein
MSLRSRDNRRSRRTHIEGVAWVFVGMPVLIVLFGRGQYTVGEAAILPIVGGLMFLWFRRHPLPWPEHYGAVEHVHPDPPDDPLVPPKQPFYMGWCDCGWLGDDQPTEEAARREIAEHASVVRDGLHAFGE